MTDTLYLSDIQHFSVGDGPGIRTTVFFKGCNLTCPWCHNPEARTEKQVILDYPTAHRQVISGRLYPLEAVVAEVMADIDFYERGRGGLTVSGGECMIHPEEVAALTRAVREAAQKRDKSITVAIDTAGCVPYSNFQTVNPYADIYLFDLKTASAEKYASIGGSLETVLSNIRALIADDKEVRLRLPLIPGFNTDAESIQALADTACALSEVGNISVDLLPFHRLGTGKYKAMGLPYAYAQTVPMTSEAVEAIRTAFISRGLSVQVEK